MAATESQPLDEGAPVFRLVTGDLINATGLAVKLQKAQDALSRYLYGQARPETQRLLDDYDSSKEPNEELKDALTDELNRLISGPSLYEQERFAGVAVTEQTRELLEKEPQERDVLRLNILLLEDAYPEELLRNSSTHPKLPVERVQTGVRLERRMLKVLKALAEYDNVTLGSILEDIILHAFEGTSTFQSRQSQKRVVALKTVYGMDYDVHASYRFAESPGPES